MSDDQRVEAVARAMAQADGENPDTHQYDMLSGGAHLGQTWELDYADRARAAIAALDDARDAEIARLREALAEEREDNLWNAYHEGVERDGRWSHAYKSEPEQLVRACGFNPKLAWYDAKTIKSMIPKIARTALNGGDDEG